MVFKIDEQNLDKCIRMVSTSTVGRILKRIDIIDDKNELKKIVKELVYEEFRNLKSTLIAYNLGVKFISPTQK